MKSGEKLKTTGISRDSLPGLVETNAASYRGQRVWASFGKARVNHQVHLARPDQNPKCTTPIHSGDLPKKFQIVRSIFGGAEVDLLILIFLEEQRY